MALETHDLASALASLGTSGSTTLTVGGFEALVVRIAPGDRYEQDTSAPALLLLIEGIGTIAIDDWRATLAGGHIANVPAQSRIVITADGERALSLLLTRITAIGATDLPIASSGTTTSST